MDVPSPEQDDLDYEELREYLRHQYQVRCLSPAEIAGSDDNGWRRARRVRELLSMFKIGEPAQLLNEPGGAEALVREHGSPAAAAEAAGLPLERIQSARYEDARAGEK